MTRDEADKIINQVHLYFELSKCTNQVADEIIGRKLPPPFPVTAKLEAMRSWQRGEYTGIAGYAAWIRAYGTPETIAELGPQKGESP